MDPVRITERKLDTSQFDALPEQIRGGKWSALRHHPYTATASAVFVLVVFGAFIVQSRGAVAPRAVATAWGGTGGSLTDPSYQQTTPVQNQPPILQQVQNTAPYTYNTGSTSSSANTSDTDASGFNTQDFLASLSHTSSTTTAYKQGASLQDAYTFIPSGLMSTSTGGKNMTADQQALYIYGNEVGSIIQSYETEHANAARVLQDQNNDRTDPTKSAAVVALADAMIAVGTSMEATEIVPKSAASAHHALAASYKESGQKLKGIASAENDADFINAIKQYDAVVDTYVHHYVALVNVFASNGVTFSQDDAGSVFTFTPAGVL